MAKVILARWILIGNVTITQDQLQNLNFLLSLDQKKHEFWVILALSLKVIKDIYDFSYLSNCRLPLAMLPPLIWSLKCKRK